MQSGGGGQRRGKSRSPVRGPIQPQQQPQQKPPAGPKQRPTPQAMGRRAALVLDALEDAISPGDVILHHAEDDDVEEDDPGLLAAPISSGSRVSSSSSSASGSGSESDSSSKDEGASNTEAAMPPFPPAGAVNSIVRKHGGGGGIGAMSPPIPISAPSSTLSAGRRNGGGGGGGGHVNFAVQEEVTKGGGGNGGGGGNIKGRQRGRKTNKGGGGKKGGNGSGKNGRVSMEGSRVESSDGSSLVSPPPLLGGRRRGEDSAGWGSMLWGTSSYAVGGNIHSMYQSVMGRKFSFIMETEDRVFWSTLLSGFSVLPLFMLVFTACSNTAMGILFTAVADVPHATGWDAWARLGLSTLGTMISLRNLLVSMYEMTMDNTAPYPLLNPTLLSRIRSIVAVRPRGLATLITVLHIHSFCTLYGLTTLGVKMGNLPGAWPTACQVFLYNLLLKLCAWQLFLLFEAWLKRRAKAQLKQQRKQQRQERQQQQAKSTSSSTTNSSSWNIFPRRPLVPLLGARQVTLLRRLRKAIVWYYAGSDLALILGMAAHYLFWGEGQELLRHQQMAGHDPHSYDELERRVVAFNCMALVISNFASLAAWTYEVLTYGAHILERSRWSESIAASRQAALKTTLALYLLSLLRHGFLPAFFTLLVVFNGLSLSKVILWSCIEVHRTVLPLLDSLKRHPLRAVGVLLAYILATRTPSDAILLTLFVAAVFWAVKVQRRPHICDIWAFGLTGIAVLMALHQAAYSALGPRLELFNVTLSPTHLNISSVVGPMSMELLPPPGSSLPGGGGSLFQRLRASSLSEWTGNGNGGAENNPVAEAKRADPKYPFCELRPHGMGLTLMEYAAFSFLAYLEKDSPSFRTFFEAAFDPEEWTIVRGPEPRSHGAVFLDAFNKRLNTSVVATRGTNPKNLFDVFQDMVLFNGAFCWDMVGQLVPLVRWIPATWTSNILYLAYLPLQLRFQSVAGHRDLALHYHPEIQEYVEAIRRERKVVLTGHSLGGGLGKIVSAKIGVPIVAISAPGVYLSHKIFDIPRVNIDRYEVNLMAPEDVVPMVDRLRGITLQMQCHRENPLDCHNLGVTLCDLYEKCGLSFGGMVGDRILGCAHP